MPHSYDGVVRLFDGRNVRKPLVEHDVGGGVWRLRWHPVDGTKLLAACMHDGFKVLQVAEACDVESTGERAVSELASSCATRVRFDAHGKDALAYGVDWCQTLDDQRTTASDLVASCSFYDHQLRSWVA